MKFENKLIKTAYDYAVLIAEKDKAIAELAANTPAGPELEKLKQERQQARTSAERVIRDMVEERKDRITGRDVLRGSALTEDAQLLTGAFPLTAADLNAMYDRAFRQHNRTMTRLVCEYASAHGVKGFNRSFYGEKQEKAEAEMWGKYALDVLNHPEYAERLNNIERRVQLLAKAHPEK